MNILFITADQWRGDCLSTLDHSVIKTPNLDALAADGVLFANHFAQCSPCGPSRASLLTGMYAMNHRSVRNGTPLDARFTNLALEARTAGYDPGLIGYTDTSPDPREYDAGDPVLKGYAGILPGFKQLVPGSEAGSAGVKPWIDGLVAKGYQVPERAVDIYNQVTGSSPPKPVYSADDSDTAFMTDHAIKFIDNQKGNPWFLHLSLLRPHPPFIAPEPYNSLYPPNEVPASRGPISPEDEAHSHPYAAYMIRHQLALEDHGTALHAPEEGMMRQVRATYYGLMSEVDHHIGRLIGQLKDTGIYDKTLIIFTSDHGEQMFDHWVLGKEHFYDQSFHIPLIIKAPGGETDKARGSIVTAFTESIDIMPTVLEMMDRDTPAQCDGRSLNTFLKGGNSEGWRREVHWELDFRNNSQGTAQTELALRADDCSLCVIRDEHFKYVHFAALPPLFFDLKSDPDECNNLAGDPAYASQMLIYAQKMLSWRQVHAERTLTGVYLSPDGPAQAMP